MRAARDQHLPRLKDLPDQVLSRIDRDGGYGALQPLLRGRINIAIILEQWDELACASRRP